MNMGLKNKHLLLLSLLALPLLAATPALAQENQAEALMNVYRPLGAGLAVGLAGIGAGIAVGIAGAAGISALTEKPEMFSNVLLVVALGEGIAIYGLIIAILLVI